MSFSTPDTLKAYSGSPDPEHFATTLKMSVVSAFLTLAMASCESFPRSRVMRRSKRVLDYCGLAKT